jgi:hypothetical protein
VSGEKYESNNGKSDKGGGTGTKPSKPELKVYKESA